MDDSSKMIVGSEPVYTRLYNNFVNPMSGFYCASFSFYLSSLRPFNIESLEFQVNRLNYTPTFYHKIPFVIFIRRVFIRFTTGFKRALVVLSPPWTCMARTIFHKRTISDYHTVTNGQLIIFNNVRTVVIY